MAETIKRKVRQKKMIATMESDPTKKITLPQLYNKWRQSLPKNVDFRSLQDITRLIAKNNCAYLSSDNNVVLSEQEILERYAKGEILEPTFGVTTRYIEKHAKAHTIKKKEKGKVRHIVSYDYVMSSKLSALLEIMYPVMAQHIPVELAGCMNFSSVPKIAGELMEELKKSQKALLCHVDVVDYFPTINQWRHIKPLFDDYFTPYKSTNGNMVDTAAIIAGICSFKGSLPQGSPMSPLIANSIAARSWGKDVIQYCKDNGIFVRIYVDNILTVMHMPDSEAKVHLREIAKLTNPYGFWGHKFSINRKTQRQKALGLILNTHGSSLPRVDKKTKKKLRSTFHKLSVAHASGKSIFPIALYWAKGRGKSYKGFDIMSDSAQTSCPPVIRQKILKDFKMYLQGMLGWVVCTQRDKVLVDKWTAILDKTIVL